MKSAMIAWMAKRLNGSIGVDDTEVRRRFIGDLKNNEGYVVEVFSRSILGLVLEYTLEFGECVCLDAENNDAHPYITCAKAIVAFMRDELLKQEIAATVSDTPR